MLQIEHILFIDIETVPIVPDYSILTPEMQEHWLRKCRSLKHNLENPTEADLFLDKAAIFSEFAKVVCIGIGCMVYKDSKWKILLKSLTATEEKVLLQKFCDAVEKFARQQRKPLFCGHNIKEFDLPFLCRRLIINGMELPPQLQLSGKKPWENENIDTLELWRFGDFKNYTSLALLASVLDIPSPKGDIDGSMVGTVYWKEEDLPRISRYCLNDVLTTAKVFLKLKGSSSIEPEPEFIFD